MRYTAPLLALIAASLVLSVFPSFAAPGVSVSIKINPEGWQGSQATPAVTTATEGTWVEPTARIVGYAGATSQGPPWLCLFTLNATLTAPNRLDETDVSCSPGPFAAEPGLAYSVGDCVLGYACSTGETCYQFFITEDQSSWTIQGSLANSTVACVDWLAPSVATTATTSASSGSSSPSLSETTASQSSTTYLGGNSLSQSEGSQSQNSGLGPLQPILELAAFASLAVIGFGIGVRLVGNRAKRGKNP